MIMFEVFHEGSRLMGYEIQIFLSEKIEGYKIKARTWFNFGEIGFIPTKFDHSIERNTSNLITILDSRFSPPSQTWDVFRNTVSGVNEHIRKISEMLVGFVKDVKLQYPDISLRITTLVAPTELQKINIDMSQIEQIKNDMERELQSIFPQPVHLRSNYV